MSFEPKVVGTQQMKTLNLTIYHNSESVGLYHHPCATSVGRIRRVRKFSSNWFFQFSLFVFLATVLAVSGCTPLKSPVSDASLAPQYRFEDVPVHPKLKISPNESFIFETQSIKAGILVYYGSESINEIVEFFKNEMPKHAWRLVNSIEAKGIVSMNFEKEGWSTLMRVHRSALKTAVEITIGPRDDGSSGLGSLKRK